MPQWFDNMLAGYAFASDERHKDVAVRDPKSGFYLVRDLECDGADISLVLTRDRKRIANDVANTASVGDSGLPTLVAKPLRNLSTGKGISIGDSESKMRSILGRPSSFELDGNRKQFRVFTYHWTDRGGEMTAEVAQIYIFKKGRLIEIDFAQGTS